MKKIAAFGEIMQRFTPPLHQRLIQASHFDVLYTGTGLNVLGALSQYGNKTKMLTTLPSNALGLAAAKTIKSFGIDAEDIIYAGSYLGLYFLEQGHGSRPSKVIYNREYSSFVMAKSSTYDWEYLFRDVSIVHFCGISLAVSENTRKTVRAAMEAAKKYGVLVSLDFNYRPTLWEKDVAKTVYEELLPYVDICFAGHRDFSEILQTVVIDSKDDYSEMIEKLVLTVAKRYPNIQFLAATKRSILADGNHQLEAFFSNMKKVSTCESEPFTVLERIGGGDAFVAGILDGIERGQTDLHKVVKFAMKSSIYKHTIVGDTLIATREEIIDTTHFTRTDLRR